MSRIVERGDLFFFYRPRVGLDEAHDLQDVQRFFVILKPERRRLYRRVIVGRKRLPDPREHERIWAFVAEVVDDPAPVREELGREAYETLTRGIRVEPEARPAGEARYAIVEHERHTHLAYVLELPRRPGPAQAVFRIRPEASYVVAVRNPNADAPPGAGLPPHSRAAYPPELMRRFGSRRFAVLDDPRFLDYEGAELVLIGAAEDVEADLGIALTPEDVDGATADIFRQLRIRPEDVPAEPLVRGQLR
jgi:hypothetical protein